MRGVPGLGCSWTVCWGSWLGDLAWNPPHSELGSGPKLRALDDGDALGFGEGWPRAGGSALSSVQVAALHLVGVWGVQAGWECSKSYLNFCEQSWGGGIRCAVEGNPALC